MWFLRLKSNVMISLVFIFFDDIFKADSNNCELQALLGSIKRLKRRNISGC